MATRFLGVPYARELVFHHAYSDAVTEAAEIVDVTDIAAVRAAATTSFAAMTRLNTAVLRRLVRTLSGTFLVTTISQPPP